MNADLIYSSSDRGSSDVPRSHFPRFLINIGYFFTCFWGSMSCYCLCVLDAFLLFFIWPRCAFHILSGCNHGRGAPPFIQSLLHFNDLRNIVILFLYECYSCTDSVLLSKKFSFKNKESMLIFFKSTPPSRCPVGLLMRGGLRLTSYFLVFPLCFYQKCGNWHPKRSVFILFFDS